MLFNHVYIDGFRNMSLHLHKPLPRIQYTNNKRIFVQTWRIKYSSRTKFAQISKSNKRWHTWNTCWVDGADDQGHFLSLLFIDSAPLSRYLLASYFFSHQLNSLHKCFVGSTSGCCYWGAFDLISVMYRGNSKNRGKQQQQQQHASRFTWSLAVGKQGICPCRAD